MVLTTNEQVLLATIIVVSVLELFFIVRAIHELRSAQLHQMLAEDLRRLQRP